MRDATTAPEYELDHARPATRAPESRSDSMSAEAASLGNAAFSGVVAPDPSRFRCAALPGASQQLARKNPKKAPDALASVGNTKGSSTTVAGTYGREKNRIKAGDEGFTVQMLSELPKQATAKLQDGEYAQLTVVKPSFKHLDSKQDAYAADQKEKAHDSIGWGPTRGPASVEQTYKDREAYWDAKGKQWQDDKKTSHQLAEAFNVGVPRANQTFLSYAKLQAMRGMLGANDDKTMNEAVVKSLEEAHVIAAAAIAKPGGPDVPAANQQVTSTTSIVRDSQRSLQTKWLAVQRKLFVDEQTALHALGAKDRDRETEIKANIEFLSNVGKVIDLSMTTMSGGAKMTEGESTEPTKSQIADMADGEKADVKDKSGSATAKSLGSKYASTAGFEVPTSASGALETVGKVVYYKELEEIRKSLARLEARKGFRQQVVEGLKAQQELEEFKNALESYQTAVTNQQLAMIERQFAYVRFGQQVDAAARKDPQAKESAPGAGKERFATVMAVTAAVREVLAMGYGALQGFGPARSPAVSRHFHAAKNNRLPLGWPEEEAEVLRSMYHQLKQFEADIKTLTERFRPIEEKAAQVMTGLRGGAGQAGRY